MPLTRTNEKRLLQAVIVILALIPVATGIAGVTLGPAFLGIKAPWPVDLDSHFRFLSGTFLATGIAWYSCVPEIERNTGRFRLLAAITFTGGVARLLSLSLAGVPSPGYRGGLIMELVVVPLLVLWQTRVSSAEPPPV
ncbi:MAG: DUF4345 domain-containing protein [Hyphomicrobiales bacterium]|nr:DUF4345 domain-containing protein [Hyphomicrobiales bacterium]